MRLKGRVSQTTFIVEDPWDQIMTQKCDFVLFGGPEFAIRSSGGVPNLRYVVWSYHQS